MQLSVACQNSFPKFSGATFLRRDCFSPDPRYRMKSQWHLKMIAHALLVHSESPRWRLTKATYTAWSVRPRSILFLLLLQAMLLVCFQARPYLASAGRAPDRCCTLGALQTPSAYLGHLLDDVCASCRIAGEHPTAHVALPRRSPVHHSPTAPTTACYCSAPPCLGIPWYTTGRLAQLSHRSSPPLPCALTHRSASSSACTGAGSGLGSSLCFRCDCGAGQGEGRGALGGGNGSGAALRGGVHYCLGAATSVPELHREQEKAQDHGCDGHGSQASGRAPGGRGPVGGGGMGRGIHC